ncbi:MAG TPA: hypothetical protein VK914_06860 [bacterium]|jgi:hypothetical protein|nr:hypothetical protein [bacterium]
MKELSKIIIVFVAAFSAGFAFQGVLATTFRKARTAVFLAEADGQVQGLRLKVADFKRREGRFPKDIPEMVAQGFWSPAQPPCERLRGCADWVTAYDGEGGFLYLSATGQIYLNTDLTREKLRSADIHKLETGDLVPPGTFF